MVEQREGAAEGRKPIVAEFKAELARELKTHVVEDAGIMTSVKEPPKSLEHLRMSNEPSVANQTLNDTLAMRAKVEDMMDRARAVERMMDKGGAAMHRGMSKEASWVPEATAITKEYFDKLPKEKLTLKDIELKERAKNLRDEKDMLAFLKDFAAVHPYVLADIFSHVAPELYQESLREVRTQRMREQMLEMIRLNELRLESLRALALFSAASASKASEEEKEESANTAELKTREEKKEKEIERAADELIRFVLMAIEEQIKSLNIALSDNAKSMLAAEVLMLVAENPKNYIAEHEVKKNALISAVNERVGAILGAA